MTDVPDLSGHPLARLARTTPRQESTAVDADVVQAAAEMRRKLGEFVSLAVAGAADEVDFRMMADEVETQARTLAQAMRVAAGTMQHRAALEPREDREAP